MGQVYHALVLGRIPKGWQRHLGEEFIDSEDPLLETDEPQILRPYEVSQEYY